MSKIFTGRMTSPFWAQTHCTQKPSVDICSIDVLPGFQMSIENGAGRSAAIDKAIFLTKLVICRARHGEDKVS